MRNRLPKSFIRFFVIAMGVTQLEMHAQDFEQDFFPKEENLSPLGLSISAMVSSSPSRIREEGRWKEHTSSEERKASEACGHEDRRGGSDERDLKDEELEELILEIVRLRHELLKRADGGRPLTDPEIVFLSRLLDEKFNRL